MAFSSPFLYASTILIWGTTFYAIHFQLGEVSPVVSVAWRFLLAAIVLFAWIALRRLPCRFTPQQHGWMLLQGLSIFSLNYVLIYAVTAELTSGLVAIIYAIVVPLNIINGAVFLRKSISLPVVIGGALGCCGLALVFWPEVRQASHNSDILIPVGIGLLAAYFASIGNTITARNYTEQMPVLQSNAFGMLYGGVATVIYALFQGIPLEFSLQPSYVLSLLYLSVFGSVLAFGAYISLIGRVGADRAAYATIVFPIVALLISSLFENYHWPFEAIIGITLVAAGNLLLLDKALLKRMQLFLNPAKLARPPSTPTES